MATVREALVPLFVRHGVNLVFNGHDHAYERSVVSDVTYVVSGGGGAPLYGPQGDNPHSLTFTSAHHAVSVTVKGDTLSGVGVRADGVSFDRFTLTQAADMASRRIMGPGLYTFGAVGARVDLTETGRLTGVTATVRHEHPRGPANVRFLGRVYTLTADGGAGYTASLALRYTDAEVEASRVSEDRLRLYRGGETGEGAESAASDGVVAAGIDRWQAVTSTVDVDGNWVTVTAVDKFSAWAIGEKRMPLRIPLWLPVILRPLPE